MYGSLSILCRNFTRYHDPYLFSLYPHHVQGPYHNRTDLFLDGSGSLDSATSQDVLGLLKVSGERFSQTIVMITHNEDFQTGKLALIVSGLPKFTPDAFFQHLIKTSDRFIFEYHSLHRSLLFLASVYKEQKSALIHPIVPLYIDTVITQNILCRYPRKVYSSSFSEKYISLSVNRLDIPGIFDIVLQFSPQTVHSHRQGVFVHKLRSMRPETIYKNFSCYNLPLVRDKKPQKLLLISAERQLTVLFVKRQPSKSSVRSPIL